jgi:uncharacterized protein (TIGR00369 family)
MNRLGEYLQKWQSGQLEPPVTKLVGIRLLECSEGNAIMEMPAGERHHNPMGIVHGGILCDLADAAMGVAMASVIGEGESFSTVELHINFFRPVRSELITARAHLVNRSQRTAYLESEITGQDGRLIARCSSICLTQQSQ